MPISIDPDSHSLFNIETGGNGAETVGSRTVFYSFPDEYRFRPADTELLGAISERTGGQLDPETEDIFAYHGGAAIRPTPLWPFLAGLALFLFLLDIGIRRAPWLWKKFQDN
jgi:hypothetical protein